jgi:hypothetical protein
VCQVLPGIEVLSSSSFSELCCQSRGRSGSVLDTILCALCGRKEVCSVRLDLLARAAVFEQEVESAAVSSNIVLSQILRIIVRVVVIRKEAVLWAEANLREGFHAFWSLLCAHGTG